MAEHSLIILSLMAHCSPDGSTMGGDQEIQSPTHPIGHSSGELSPKQTVTVVCYKKLILFFFHVVN